MLLKFSLAQRVILSMECSHIFLFLTFHTVPTILLFGSMECYFVNPRNQRYACYYVRYTYRKHSAPQVFLRMPTLRQAFTRIRRIAYSLLLGENEDIDRRSHGYFDYINGIGVNVFEMQHWRIIHKVCRTQMN